MDHSQSRLILSCADVRTQEERFRDSRPTLMNRAGHAAFKLATAIADVSGPILVMVGPGNNGGDGLVLAALLKRAGRDVLVAFAGDEERLPPDAADALQQWRAAGGDVATDFSDGNWALAVDALFGIGLRRAPTGKFADWIERFNRLACRRLALDIPSGLDADTGRALGPTVQATDTLSFIALKPGLLTLDGPDHCGTVHLDTLDLPPAEFAAGGHQTHPDDFADYLRPRKRNSHKGLYGDVGIIGGAPGMVGAAWIAGRAALMLGAGRVFVGCVADNAPALDPATPELMMRSPGETYSAASVLAVGPGLGQTEMSNIQLRRALTFGGPLVLDADALNLIGANPVLQEQLAARSSPTIITPHPAEAGRLLQEDSVAIQSDRVRSALRLAERYQAHVVLKGCGSVVASPDGSWAINTTGNPGMAAAGMGDALTGFVASLLAQHWPARAALEFAVHLHGAAADHLAMGTPGQIGITASELMLSARQLRNRWVGTRGRD